MKAKAIIYTSNSGHTTKYAEMLGNKLNLPIYSLKEAGKKLEKGTKIIYMGWLFANSVKCYKKAAKRYNIIAVCGVGLCDTGQLINEVRKATKLPDSIPLFTIQGGMDKSKLRGINKLLINMLTKGLQSQKERSEQDEHMLSLLQNDVSYVSEDNLTEFIKYYEAITEE